MSHFSEADEEGWNAEDEDMDFAEPEAVETADWDESDAYENGDAEDGEWDEDEADDVRSGLNGSPGSSRAARAGRTHPIRGQGGVDERRTVGRR
ncbi:MAG TPA: hypothetical protein VHG08_17100 [Longimicrobium sp.]|nr:hypothetical protein [Longimicrobium sp.]